MTQQLDRIFGELGISQYLDAFVDQGFDTWETILDITESDLDALGVKLGHRRKLQRRIANFRGVANGAALVSPMQPSIEDARLDARHDAIIPEPSHRDAPTGVIAKRKYRRHPKPDENAPERPPSAYVLFSNKMRDELKDRNLSFTEIAKLVGENWQNISQTEKEPFETKAHQAKDKYNKELAIYKKTAEYRLYVSYLQEFKAKHPPSHDKDGSKRPKLSSESHALGPTLLSNGLTPPRARSTTASADSSEPPPVSARDSSHSPASNPIDRSAELSPRLSVSPRELPSSSHVSRRNSAWADGQRGESGSQHRSLPSLSDVFDGSNVVNGIAPSSEVNGFASYQSQLNGSPGPAPSTVNGGSRPPSLRKGYSSTGSTSSTYSFPKTPVEGSLPIHALLSGKPTPPFETAQFGFTPNGRDEGKSPPSMYYPTDRASAGDPPSSHGIMANGSGYFSSPQPIQSNPPVHHLMTNGLSPHRTAPPPLGRIGGNGADLDAISALLKAGEIVDRQAR